MHLDFLSIDKGTIVFTLCNTLILFLILRHFLFGRVNEFLEKRQKEISSTYEEADKAKEHALALEADYSKKLLEAKEESAEIVRNATKKAQSRSDEIIFAAKSEAENIISKANSEIEREKKRAANQIKDEISEIAIAVASKVVGKELKTDDNDKLIEDFIANLGEEK
ncbi:MAG TPA: F0F1 ATP synthase subunit B [Oscillospiraceae bacterium]|jgi:F-type H+-transporting ATPase subunit b|nr:atpF [Oscillospiraceae bacterium]MDN5378425.1 F-type H+-transporting ATPase subunit b [Clostridiales bacterium]HOV40915.1 F0F1 ATP synthase subunit B [Oscillospiraceae bacterium]